MVSLMTFPYVFVHLVEPVSFNNLVVTIYLMPQKMKWFSIRSSKLLVLEGKHPVVPTVAIKWLEYPVALPLLIDLPNPACKSTSSCK